MNPISLFTNLQSFVMCKIYKYLDIGNKLFKTMTEIGVFIEMFYFCQ